MTGVQTCALPISVYYASAIHLLVYGKRSDAVDRLLAKGAKELPTRWEIPFLLGYNAYFLKGNALEAAEKL